MIELVIFDLDGVLLDAKDMHYESLNNALVECYGSDKYIISYDDHLTKFDGLPTKKKLQILTKERGLPESDYNKIYNCKQKATITYLKTEVLRNDRLITIFKELRKYDKKICVASNSIRETTRVALIQLGLMEYVDYYYSNEDVTRAKPSAEMYLRAMIDCKVDPIETLIVEDSHIGRQAVYNSGANLCGVKNVDDVTIDKIWNKIDGVDNRDVPAVKWQGKNMNIVIPMAGAGSRFEKAGYTFPKPLVEVNGKPMIQAVVDNLNIDANYIFIVQKSHYEKYNLQQVLSLIAPGCKIIQVDGITEGAACTTLLAKQFIDNDEPLLFANSDQFVDWNSNEFMYSVSNNKIDAAILTFKSTHPKWSYVKLDSSGYVCEVAEKNPISDIATVGIYYWAKGSDYVKYAEQMINKDIRVNNEFYVCPVFNEAIIDKKRIRTYSLSEGSMWGIGTPEDLEHFLKYHKD